MTDCQSSCHVLHVHKILLSENILKKTGDSLKMLTSSYKFQKLWTTFARKLMKRPNVLIKYFQSSIQFLHVYKVSLFQIFH